MTEKFFRLIKSLMVGYFLLTFMVGNAHAAVVVDVRETSAGAVFTASGTLDLASLTSSFPAPVTSFIAPSSGGFGIGPVADTTADRFTGFTSAGPFGSGGIATPSSGTGDRFGVGNTLYVPSGFVSGGTINATSTFSGQDFADLGLTSGTYVWTLPSDIITMNIVPIPATVWLFGSGLLGLIGVARRKPHIFY